MKWNFSFEVSIILNVIEFLFLIKQIENIAEEYQLNRKEFATFLQAPFNSSRQKKEIKKTFFCVYLNETRNSHREEKINCVTNEKFS